MNLKYKISINYLFFAPVFLFLLVSSSVNILLVDHPFCETKAFFLINALLQSLTEISCIVYLTHFFEKHLPRALFFTYLGVLVLLLTTQIVDFFLTRMMDLSIFEGINFIRFETFSSFLELLKAANISLTTWLLIGGCIFALPLLGILFFKGCAFLADKKPLLIAHQSFFLLLLLLPLSLLLWNTAHAWTIHANLFQPMQKSLPWKTTIFQPTSWRLSFKGCLRSDFSSSSYPLLKEKANVYLFIIESLREDFITEENTPKRFLFKKEELSFDLALSGSNSTHLSWFSILYGKYPFYWKKYKKDVLGSQRSFPYLLQQTGYHTHLYSAAELAFYGMKELLFGKDTSLIHSPHFFSHLPSSPLCQCDRDAMQSLCNDVKQSENREKNCFITFLDSSHFPYSWPDTRSLFLPLSGRLSCFSPCPSNVRLESIKNRYRNAIHWIDDLFGEFIKTLKEQKLYENAVIIVTADHGEEFFEHGHLFHASVLSHEQTNVPLYFKLGNTRKNAIPLQNQRLISHVDILPTLFHYLFKILPTHNQFDGQSIFDPNKQQFALSARFNGSRPPYEFFLHDGEKKLLVRFQSQNALFEPAKLEFLLLSDRKDAIDLSSRKEIKKEVDKRFQRAFQKIFPSVL